jgi:hypothetical protein
LGGEAVGFAPLVGNLRSGFGVSLGTQIAVIGAPGRAADRRGLRQLDQPVARRAGPVLDHAAAIVASARVSRCCGQP